MKSYSPYENVGEVEYPPILAMTSLNDSRVYYVEPAKWVAALRHTKADGHPVLLRTQMRAGHGGVSGRYERWKESAFQYSWLLATAMDESGLEPLDCDTSRRRARVRQSRIRSGLRIECL